MASRRVAGEGHLTAGWNMTPPASSCVAAISLEDAGGECDRMGDVNHRVLRLSLCLLFAVTVVSASATDDEAPITLRAWGVAKDDDPVRGKMLLRFQEMFPHIRPVHPGGLQFGGNQFNVMMEVLPLMQIAGGSQPDVMMVWLGHGQRYVQQRFLHPLDKHLEQSLGLDIVDGHLLSLEAYFARLQTSNAYAHEIEPRAPPATWRVMRQPCPYGGECAYVLRHGMTVAEKHEHVWGMPVQVVVGVMTYRRDLFRKANLPGRPPETLEELLQFARALTDPDNRAFGLRVDRESLGGTASMLLKAMGGQVAGRDKEGRIEVRFHSKEAVEACYFLCRLFYEPYVNPGGKRLESVVFPGSSGGSVQAPPWKGGIAEIGMFQEVVDQKFYWDWRSPSQFGYGALPAGPGGESAGGIGGRLAVVYAGLEDPRRIDAAWQWVRFLDGPEARQILADDFVSRGKGAFLQKRMLHQTGYGVLARQVSAHWHEGNEKALQAARSPQLGLEIIQIEKDFGNAVSQIWSDATVVEAVRAKDGANARKRIRQILETRVAMTNRATLKRLTPAETRMRSWAAFGTAVAIFVIFVFVFRRVLRTFAAVQEAELDLSGDRWQFGRYKWAYMLLLPAVGSIAIWTYYPLARGSVMAFQDYNIRGFTQWVGMQNFSDVLFSEEFWFAVWISLKYVVLFTLFGFTAPIILAFLLTEVPRGKILLRTIYYLPAVLSGIVVIFLWKGFYTPEGLINQVLNGVFGLLNELPGVEIAELDKDWLKDPAYALFFVLLPVVWLSAGPGCLIYLAALKTVPDDLYEAADIDGAGLLHKAFHVAIPGIKGLIVINFIGVIVAQMKGGSEFVLAMTQGGPHTPYGQTQVVGLHIYWEAFGRLRMGVATAMAWVIGAMLVGFTVLQMQRLSRMEFRSAASEERPENA